LPELSPTTSDQVQHWRIEEVEVLKGTAAYAQATQIRGEAEEAVDFALSLSSLRECVRRAVSSTSSTSDIDDLVAEAVRGAHAAVLCRSFSLEDDDPGARELIPLLDTLQHHEPPSIGYRHGEGLTAWNADARGARPVPGLPATARCMAEPAHPSAHPSQSGNPSETEEASSHARSPTHRGRLQRVRSCSTRTETIPRSSSPRTLALSRASRMRLARAQVTRLARRAPRLRLTKNVGAGRVSCSLAARAQMVG
jgi:hypothetical protein